jgi:hypothetical protein
LQTNQLRTIEENCFDSELVVFATNSVWLKQNSAILSGDVVVNSVSPSPMLDSNAELTIGESVTTSAGYELKANRIKVKQGAIVASDVFYNELTNNGIITGDTTTPLELPVVETLPTFKEGVAGTQDIVVLQDESITLAEGNYRDIVVKAGGSITFTGGVYNVRSIDSRDNTQLLFNASTEVRVADKFDTDLKVYVGPSEGSSVDASDIIFYVAGINGSTGNLGATPKAAQVGINNTVFANFYAPNGTLWLREETTATGAFLAKDVIIGIGAQVNLKSGF